MHTYTTGRAIVEFNKLNCVKLYYLRLLEI